MCNLSDAIVQRGFKRGFKKGFEKSLDGQIKLIEVIMQRMNKTFEEVLSIPDFTEAEKNALRFRFHTTREGACTDGGAPDALQTGEL